ncbi:MAG TPA: PQQ-binding-like beta-propeller repeat protein [Actinomycetota bacterium]|nr:PQQ-binding-like beta-propeller repeat protein [Actinomycetota bacterium]
MPPFPRPPRLLASLGLAVSLTALAAGAAQAAAYPVLTYGYGNHRGGYDANETTLGPANAPSLHKVWSAPLGGVTISQPMVVPGVREGSRVDTLVITGSENGTLYAFRALTGAVVWKRFLGKQDTGCSDLPNGEYGVSGTVDVDSSAGRVYVAGNNGKLYSLALATGKTVKGWPQVVTTHPGLEHVYSALTRVGNDLYVETASYCDVAPYHGRIEEFSISAHTRIHTWYVDGTHGPSGGGIWGQGGVSVDSSGNVYTATGNALASPEDLASADAVVRLSSSLVREAIDKPPLTGGDVDFGASPLLFQPPGCPLEVAVENKTGVLLVYHADSIGTVAPQRLQVGDVNDWQFNSIPAYDPKTNLVYVTSSSDSSDVDGHGDPLYTQGLTAFGIQGDCGLNPTPVWSAPANLGYEISVSPPTVANGVVYYGDGGGDQELAFNAATGAPLWNSASTIGDYIFAAPTVANGALYVGSWDGHLYKFAP